jgi:PIN domain
MFDSVNSIHLSALTIPAGVEEVVFLDTNTIIDLIRGFSRDEIQCSVEALRKGWEKITAPYVHFLASSVSLVELKGHFDKESSIGDLYSKVKIFNLLIEKLTVLGLRNVVKIELGIVENEFNFKKKILTNFIENSGGNGITFIEYNDEIIRNAADRVFDKTPPGQNGNFKDCVIFETLLSAKQSSSSGTWNFISNDSKDFIGESDHELNTKGIARKKSFTY